MRRRGSWLPDSIKGKLLVEARKKIMHLDYIKKNYRYLEFFSYSIKVICVCEREDLFFFYSIYFAPSQNTNFYSLMLLMFIAFITSFEYII